MIATRKETKMADYSFVRYPFTRWICWVIAIAWIHSVQMSKQGSLARTEIISVSA